MGAAGIISEFNNALAEEVAYLQREGGRPLLIIDGVLVDRGENGFLYIFELEIEAFLLDGTPVRVETGLRETRGEVISIRGSELTLALHENIGDFVERADVFCEPWFLLSVLQERLDETPERNLEMAMQVMEKVPAFPRRFIPPAKAAMAQEDAVRLAGSRDVTFIWGPPGTGKTETVARIADLFFKQGWRVLVVSHANIAVDGAVLRIAARLKQPAASGLIARYGWARLPVLRQSGLLAFSQAAARCPDQWVRRKKLDAERSALLADLRAGRKPGSRLSEVDRQLRELSKALKEAAVSVAGAARVLGCTLATAALDPVIYQGHFDAVLLDEASMAYVPQVFFAASLARKKMVVSGDFRQLAPIALAGTEGVKRWLRRDIFEQTGIAEAFDAGNLPDVAVLRLQRRMHPAVAGFVNDTVYGGQLYNAPETTRRADLAAAAPCPGAALTLVDVSDLNALCYRHALSRFNPFSAFLALTLAKQIRLNGLTVGLLTPYAAQARLLNALAAGLLGAAGARSEAAGLVAATIHRFQGAEQDAVVLDLVDAFPQRAPGGLLARREGNAGKRLLNVAVTRARGKLFVLAHRVFLESRLAGDSAVLELFRFIGQNGRVIKSRELLSELPDHIGGENLALDWYAERWPAMKAWQTDMRQAAVVQMDWPVAAGPPERLVAGALREALAGGARVSMRAGLPSTFPPDLRPYTVKRSAVWSPVTATAGNCLWYGCPWPGDGRVDRFSVRVSGERVCRTLMYLLEMELRKGFFQGRYAGLKAYVENRLTCSFCGNPLTVRAGTTGGYFLGCTAYPRCEQPVQKLTLEILDDYLAAAGLTCPAGHLLKAVNAARGPLVVCSHSPACRCVFQVKDLL
ncbi:MAG: RecBCD enzyme subunit RecD [Pelotomaculum sp. PtaU1.Bin065]|nr:MAG: RecBCD enzyme subunit RecD [Pelotomaculum sp. PtaU1.Bin065]